MHYISKWWVPRSWFVWLHQDGDVCAWLGTGQVVAEVHWENAPATAMGKESNTLGALNWDNLVSLSPLRAHLQGTFSFPPGPCTVFSPDKTDKLWKMGEGISRPSSYPFHSTSSSLSPALNVWVWHCIERTALRRMECSQVVLNGKPTALGNVSLPLSEYLCY